MNGGLSAGKRRAGKACCRSLGQMATGCNEPSGCLLLCPPVIRPHVAGGPDFPFMTSRWSLVAEFEFIPGLALDDMLSLQDFFLKSHESQCRVSSLAEGSLWPR